KQAVREAIRQQGPNLSALLATLNLLAFLFHTLLELFDSSYQCLRQLLPRKTFFDDLRALTRYLCFDSWEALKAFMIRGLELQTRDTS
ncbi:MAG: hypothetical protein P8Y27_17220, partial [Chromatiaceae bacterium]